MRETREEQFKRLHQELWQWLADHPDKEKGDWPRWSRNGGDVDSVRNKCFACALYPDDECNNCPCDWDNIYNFCDKAGSPYVKWGMESDLGKRSEYALQVKNAWKK